jgi:hypothetical protein
MKRLNVVKTCSSKSEPAGDEPLGQKEMVGLETFVAGRMVVA